MDSPVHFERGPNLLGHRKGEISPRSNGSPANRASPRGVGSIKKLGGGVTGFEGNFWNERASKKIFQEMLATVEGGREGKINAIINQRPLRPTHG